MDMIQYHKSVADELEAVKQRIRNLMSNPHWLTDGEVKESILRYILRRHLPDKFQIGRGFIFTSEQCSKQVDLIVYDSSFPLIFREGDLVFVTPDAVKAIIEVKAKTTTETLSLALDQLIQSSQIVADYYNTFSHARFRHYNLFTGVFSYETDIEDPDLVLDLLQDKANGDSRMVVNHLCLNDSLFVKFWIGGGSQADEWRSYWLDRLAPAYFINNIINEVAPLSVFSNEKVWFPESKEIHRTGTKPLRKVPATNYPRQSDGERNL